MIDVDSYLPNTNAPKNSKIPAINIALRLDKAPEPTLVPKALATSLAPLLNERKKRKKSNINYQN